MKEKRVIGYVDVEEVFSHDILDYPSPRHTTKLLLVIDRDRSSVKVVLELPKGIVDVLFPVTNVQ